MIMFPDPRFDENHSDINIRTEWDDYRKCYVKIIDKGSYEVVLPIRKKDNLLSKLEKADKFISSLTEEELDSDIYT
jgi:hypothetical protein